MSQENKLQVGIQLFPNFSTGIPDKDVSNADMYHGIECFVFSYSAGLRVEYVFSDKWTFSSGLLFNKTGDRSIKLPPDPQRGFFWTYRYYKTSLYYLEIPFLINRSFGKHWNMEFGASPILNLWNKNKIYYEGGNYTINKDYYDVNLFGLFTNFGLGYRVDFDKSKLNIMPYFQFNILEGIRDYLFLDYLPARRNVAGGLKMTFMF